jgi:Na+/proline symporter
MRLTRLWVVLLSAAAAGLSLLRYRGIVELSAFSGSIYAVCFLPALIVGLFWRRGTADGAFSSLGLGLAATVAWFFLKDHYWPNLHELYVGLAVSLPTYVVVSLLTGPGGRASE